MLKFICTTNYHYLTLLKAKIRFDLSNRKLHSGKNKELEIHKKKWQKLLPFIDNIPLLNTSVFLCFCTHVQHLSIFYEFYDNVPV